MYVVCMYADSKHVRTQAQFESPYKYVFMSTLFMYACMHVCMHVCIYVCMYVCMYSNGHNKSTMRFLNAIDHCYRYKRCLYEVSYVI